MINLQRKSVTHGFSDYKYGFLGRGDKIKKLSSLKLKKNLIPLITSI